MAAADYGPDQAFVAQDRERAFGGALGDLVLLGDGADWRDAAGEFAFADLGAQDCRYLQVERLGRFMINNGHMIMLGTYGLTCVFGCSYRDL